MALIKKIKNILIPDRLRQLRRIKKRMQASFLQTLCHAHVVDSNDKLQPCEDFARQFDILARYASTDVLYNYVYPYNPWSRRIPSNGSQTIASITVDYAKVLESSLRDIRERILLCKDETFKENESRIIDTIYSICGQVQSSLSKQKASRSKELQTYLAHMLDNKPTSFDEALQKILFYNGLFWQVGHWHNGLGRLDLILNEYYEHDKKAGLLTKEEARLKLVDFVRVLGAHTHAKSSVLPGDTGQYILLGGIDKEGNTVQNDLTELFLVIFTELKVPDPKLIFRVNASTFDTILQKAVDCIITGCGSPLLMNEKMVMDNMIQFGYKKEDVWNVGTSACWEPLIIGESFDQNNPFMSVAVPEAIDEVLQSESGLESYDELLAETKACILNQIDDVVYDIRFDVSPLYSLFFDYCIEREKDFALGGAEYAYHGVQVVGLPNLINALLNIKTYVFEQKILTLDICRIALAANYKGYEDVRKLLLSNEKQFGSTHQEVIALTNEITTFISKEVEKHTCNGAKLKVGFSSPQYMRGHEAPASIDGRKAYEPYAVHISPVSQKVDIQEVLKFAGALDYSGNRLNGNVVDCILPSAFIKSKDKLAIILRNAMTSGVYELQFNVLDAAKLRDAKQHPEKYPNLVVRVWGFSAYFNELPEEYKDNLIARAEANE